MPATGTSTSSSRSRGSLFTLSRLRFLSRGRRRSAGSSALESALRSVGSTALVPVCSASSRISAALALMCSSIPPRLPGSSSIVWAPARRRRGRRVRISSRSLLSPLSARRERSISRAAARAVARAFISASLRGAGSSRPRSRLPRSVRGAEAGAEARRRPKRRTPSP